MFKNYFKITWRSLVRQKLYTSINIGGLAIGITAFMLISIYTQYEQSYDMHYPNASNIYNIYQRQETNFSLGSDLWAVTPAALPSTLMAKYPEVEGATSMDLYNTLLSCSNENYLEDVLFTDENYFDVFAHRFLKGDAGSAFEDKQGAIVTESFAKKAFGDKDPMGQKIVFWGNREAYITGVIEDLPSNTTLMFTCILSIRNSNYYLEELAKTEWNGNSYYTFFTLKDQTNIEVFEGKIQSIVDEHWGQNNIPSTYLVSPLEELHLRANVNEDFGVKGNGRQIHVFALIAIVVLALAAVNYMNLAIARSVKRAKEVGLRKAIGAEKRQLIFQFLLESTFLSFLSLALGMVLLQAVTPLFGRLVERELSILMIYDLNLIPTLLVVALLIGLISGSYPALFMSSLKPTLVLKGKIQISGSGNILQRILIILQYVISIIMITLSIVVYLQMRYIDQKELGFQKDQIMTYEIRNRDVRDRIEILRQEFESNPLTSSITFSSHLPTNIESSTFLRNDRSGGNIYRLYADPAFLEVYELELLSGRFLNEQDHEEKLNFVLNETAAKALGWTAEEAIGKQFVNEIDERKTVVGVVKDFHMHSMHIPVAPLMIGNKTHRRYISVKVQPENVQQTMAYMEEVITPFTSFPFEFQFVNDKFDSLYKEDMRQAEVIGFFTILAITIASLGLFGLAAFNVSQRIKEIGIRKVLGATMGHIVITFSKNFMGLVTLAFALATPLSWVLSDRWLQNFSYRIEVEWWIFLAAGVSAILLAFATISSQSIKVSLTNPAESLRNE